MPWKFSVSVLPGSRMMTGPRRYPQHTWSFLTKPMSAKVCAIGSEFRPYIR